MTLGIGRRNFIALLSGAAAWPVEVRAQQSAKLKTIGLLGVATPSAWGPWVAAFVQRLRELGWIEGRSVAIEYRWTEGRNDRLAEIAADLSQRHVDVVVTAGTAAVNAVKQALPATPIVFALAGDPVGTGMVASLARPGGNVTGMSAQLPDTDGRRLELLHEVVPGLRRVAIMANVGFADTLLEMGDVQRMAKTLGLDVLMLEIRRAEDIAPACGAPRPRASALRLR